MASPWGVELPSPPMSPAAAFRRSAGTRCSGLGGCSNKEEEEPSPTDLRRWLPASAARTCSPTDVLFTHPVRNPFFTDGRPLAESVEALRADEEMKLPIMKFVEFDGKLWSRSNRRLKCYRDAGANVLVEGEHFRMHTPDKHFFDGLNHQMFFTSQEDVATRTFCSLCEKDFQRRLPYVTHCEEVHGVSLSTRCLHCKKTFSSARAQLNHVCEVLRAKLDKGEPHCCICRVHFSTYREYVQHCGKVHGVIVGSPHCPIALRHLVAPLDVSTTRERARPFLIYKRRRKRPEPTTL